MFSTGRRNYWVERGPDGRLREARDLPEEPLPRERAGEKRSGADEVVIEVPDASPIVETQEVRLLRRNLPSFGEVERLLDLYVATGEGRGAYTKAVKTVEQEHRRRFVEHYYGDDDDRFDDFINYGGPGPGGGGPPRSMPIFARGSYDYDLDEYSERGERSRHPTESIYVTRAPRERRRTQEGSDDSDDDDDRPTAGQPPLPRPSGGGPSSGPRGSYVINLENPRNARPGALDLEETTRVTSRPPQEGARRENVFVRTISPRRVVIHQDNREIVDEEHIRPPVRIAERYRSTRRRMQPTVQEVSDEDGEVSLRSIPSEEDDLRLSTTRELEVVRGPRPRSRRVQSIFQSSPGVRLSQRRSMRGGGLPEHIVEEMWGQNFRRRLHLRGGGPVVAPPTKTAAVGGGVVDDFSTASKTIALYFFSVSKGRIISSRKRELYRTFRELYPHEYSSDVAHSSDVWLVNRLKEHYWTICRRGQRSIWDLTSMRTIGFAIFIRFERTVKRGHDPGNYFVTARAPAISAEGQEAVSHFVYMMRYPLQKSKMMLFLLDRMAGSTKRGNDHNTFYAVEIKETFDTSKIYFLLAILILVSTAAGVVYSVVKSDPGTGLSIASYILACLSLILAVVVAGEWLGLRKPDAFSFAYDWVENRVVGKDDLDRIAGGRLSTYQVP
ncbi:hypothetical protein PV08_02376 [Exophiala spinifera]|uniref:Uncharacterized protein n=1 Tax=Exophiala spinifera TaxID=91928 RepID=A0A0D2C3A9_9EURO|nr:uncharacterized protein PV08_02376 [Exophiala spinifera]KIW18089.1 hypothetical protein PV08_02376 [Exophiala spinifera]